MSDKKTAEKPIPVSRKPVPEDGIGERVKEAREGRQWTQSVLSARTKLADPNGEGISRTVLVGYESGKYKPGAREIRLLAEALHVTPNWLLYGTEKPIRASLPSMEFLQGDNDLEKAFRFALALLVLKPHERETLASLLFSLAGRELGDAKLSGLMVMARICGKETVEGLQKEFGTTSIEEAVRNLSEGMIANWGTSLRFNEEGEVINGKPMYPEPPSQA